jgi:hypothetical protein
MIKGVIEFAPLDGGRVQVRAARGHSHLGTLDAITLVVPEKAVCWVIPDLLEFLTAKRRDDAETK